jgi:hypothetical protein
MAHELNFETLGTSMIDSRNRSVLVELECCLGARSGTINKTNECRPPMAVLHTDVCFTQVIRDGGG